MVGRRIVHSGGLEDATRGVDVVEGACGGRVDAERSNKARMAVKGAGIAGWRKAMAELKAAEVVD